MSPRRPDISDRDRATVVALHHAGNGLADICRVVARSPEAVSAVLREAGITNPSGQTRANRTGDDLRDPRRADVRLRRF